MYFLNTFILSFDRLTDWEEEKEREAKGLQSKKRKKSDISANGLRRLAMRGGVRRIQKRIMPHLKIYMKLFLEQVHLSVSLVVSFFF